MKKVKILCLSAVVMGASALLLLSLAALVIAKSGKLPQSLLPLLTTLVCCAAVFLGSLVAAVGIGERGIWYGLGCGLAFAGCVAAVSLLAYQVQPQLASVWKLAALLLSGAVGGILGVNRKKKVKF